MIENNRNSEQIYGRNDMIMLDQNNKIYGSLGLADNYVMKTEEGTRLILNNPKLGRFGDVLTEFNIYGRSEQKQYSGKNLAHGKNEKYYIDTSVNLCGFNNNDIGMAIDVSNLTNVTISTRSIQDRYRIGCVDTVPTDAKKVTCYNGRNKDGTKDSYTIDTTGHNYLIVNATKLQDIQVEKGSEATSYEPYTGGIPSPSPDYPQEIKSVVNPVVKVCGKNLWNPIVGGFISNLNGSITAGNKSSIAVTDFIKTSEKDITVIARNFSPAIKDAYSYRIGFYDAEKKWIKNIIPSDGNKYSINTFKITGAEYIRVSAPSGVYDTIQIEIGSEATSYEPYKEQSVQFPYTLNAIPVASGGNVTIDGQQWVCDEVDLERGVKVQRVKVKELNPGDKWSYQKLASGNNNFQVRMLNADMAKNSVRSICNILPFKNAIWNDSIQNLPKIYANNQEITASFPPSSEYSSLEAFKQLLTNVKSVIYYALATPIETPLTPAEIAAFNALKTYYPVTIVENNYNTWMKATYKSIESV